MFLFYLLLCSFFILGGALILVGFFKKKNKQLTKFGLIICCVLFGIVLIPLFIVSMINLFKNKPSQRDLVGEYEIVEVRNLNFDKNSFGNYKLVFKSDSTFTLTPTPSVAVCENGRYKVDYSFDNNELSFQCGPGYMTGHIDRGFGGYRIEFIIGDPDTEESIYFGKRFSKR